MLSKLLIQNYALIDSIEIDFKEGLTIITGETGAGKSILLGALSLLLGQRLEHKSFFNKEKKCIIEGHFYIPKNHLQALFIENDIDYEAITILRREINADGKSRAFINDTPVNLSILKIFAESLIDIHSQHAVLELNSQKFQLLVLDALSAHSPLLSEYQKTFKNWQKENQTLQELIELAKKSNSDNDYFQFQFNELENAQLQAGEQEKWELEIATLSHAEAITSALQTANYQLSENEVSIQTQLKDIIQQLQSVAKFQESIPALTERLQSIQIELKDIDQEIHHVSNSVYLNEERLQELNDRLHVVYQLQQKHKVNSIQELLALKNEFELKISGIENLEAQIKTSQNNLEKSVQLLQKYAAEISQNRRSVLPLIEGKVMETLAKLGMPNAQLKIEMQVLNQFQLSGNDEVAFLFNANKGAALGKVGSIASGGELSRLMLSIKQLIAQKTALATIIFDEIDTGISGEIALQMGQVLKQLAAEMQVITITHLPQIASVGSQHLFVYKEEGNEQTKTQIKALTATERIDEIAQMLSGKNPNEAAIENAKILLQIK